MDFLSADEAPAPLGQDDQRPFPAQGRSGEALLRKRQQQAHRRRMAFYNDLKESSRR